MFFIHNTSLLHDLQQRGVVGKWGITTYGLSAPFRAMEHPKIFSFIQIPFNVLDRLTLSVLESHLNGPKFTFIARSIFLQGLLTKNDKSSSIQLSPLNPFINSMKKIATRFDLSLSEICLRFPAYDPSIGIAIFITQSLREPRINLSNYIKGPLNNDIIEVIDDILVERIDLLDPRNWQQNK